MSITVVFPLDRNASALLLLSAVLQCCKTELLDDNVTSVFAEMTTPTMGTNSQSTTGMEAADDVPAPAHSKDDIAVCITSVKGLKENWQKWSNEHQEYQKHNPFSHDTRPSVVVPQRGQDDYGRPVQGSMTEQRGKDALTPLTRISREVQELCEVIRDIGEPRDKHGDRRGSDGKVISVEFGKLFERYVTISNKLVGILLRARKQKLVEFEGEMLWQGQDDHVVITLVQ